MSARLVAARMITPEFVPKPSISVSSWLRVFSLSSFDEKPVFLPLALPTASISSMNTIQGAFSLACLNRSLTLEAPTPTNISTKSEPEIEKNGTFASPATAFANRVLPVPGGPTSNAPLGIFPPRAVYLAGLRKKSTISITSIFASSSPATSLNVTLMLLSLSYTLAWDFPTLKIPPPPPPPPTFFDILRNAKNQMASIMIGSSSQSRTLPQ